MRLSDVQHQDRALVLLRRALRSGRTPHAYLFEGPEGVGKESAAQALAARLLCEDDTLPPDADACERCAACRLMASGNHPDFHLIHRGLHKLHPERTIRQSKGLFLIVDVIRHFLIGPAGMKPSQGRRRVFLIRDAERMNEEAQNALLKTLEEPPGSAVLILVTASAARLLPTIRSRCQHVPFGSLPPKFVAQELTLRLGLVAADAQALARLADGRLGMAIRWHQIGLLAAFDEVAQCVERVTDGDPEAFGQALIEIATGLATQARQAMAEDQDSDEAEDEESTRSSGKTVPTDELRDALKLALLLVAALYRDALLQRSGAATLRIVPRQPRLIDDLADRNAPERLDACLQAAHEAERMLDRNVAPQLVGERLAVALLGELPVF